MNARFGLEWRKCPLKVSQIATSFDTLMGYF